MITETEYPERFWFALIGLGLDIEGDDRNAHPEEYYRRIDNAMRATTDEARRAHLAFVLEELKK